MWPFKATDVFVWLPRTAIVKLATEDSKKGGKQKRKREDDTTEDVKEGTPAMPKSVTLPPAVISLFEGLYSEEHDIELTADMIQSVSPYGDDGSLFTFQFVFKGEKLLHNSFCLKHRDSWFITPKVVLPEECDQAIIKMKEHLETEWDLDQMGVDSIATLDLKIDHVLFDFEKDEEALTEKFPVVFRFVNEFSDQGLWCGINSSTGQSEAFCNQ